PPLVEDGHRRSPVRWELSGPRGGRPPTGPASLAGSRIESALNAPSRPRIPQGPWDFFEIFPTGKIAPVAHDRRADVTEAGAGGAASPKPVVPVCSSEGLRLRP